MQKLVLIDGNAIVHRAFHALPPLSKNGVQTNAVYGFFSMILRILETIAPDYLIVCFDRAAPTFRQQMFVGYQAQRPKMVDELSNQFKILHEMLDKAKINIFEVDGYEADDLIGTLANQAIKESENTEVIILTGDRDLLQLVEPRIRILAPIVGVTKMILFDEDKVIEKYGLKPTQIVDYKALVGDASDNYPGVTGIGPKTARDLLNKYETLEGIYAHIGEIPPKVAERLATDAEQAALAKKLATIDIKAPVNLKIEECGLVKMDNRALLGEFSRIGFQSLVDRYSEQEKVHEKLEKDKKKTKQMELI